MKIIYQDMFYSGKLWVRNVPGNIEKVKAKIFRNDNHEVVFVISGIQETAKSVEEKINSLKLVKPDDWNDARRLLLFEFIHHQRRIDGFYYKTCDHLSFNKHIKLLDKFKDEMTEFLAKVVQHVRLLSKNELANTLTYWQNIRFCQEEYYDTEICHAITELQKYSQKVK